MILRDKKYRYFCCLIISAIAPLLSEISITIKPSVAQTAQVENLVVYVDSQTGNDDNSGQRNTPLKTITQALKIAPAGATISLAPGVYSEETGETFPLVIKRSVTLKGIAGGQGSNVVIIGSGAFISPTAAEQNVTIAAIKKVNRITGVTVTNPDTRGHGIWIESANPTVTYSSFMRNNHAGLSVNGNSTAIITNNYFRHNGSEGLLVHGTSTATVQDNTFDSTGFGVSIVEKGTAILENNTFTGNRIGVILEGSGKGILRNNTITNSGEYGLVAIANAQANLGDSQQLGNNVFSNNKKLDIQNITSHPISATGTQINGKTEGKLDFSDRALASASLGNSTANNTNSPTVNYSRLRNNPLPSKQASNNNSIESTASNLQANSQTLPPPPVITSNVSTGDTTKEYVFSAPNSNTSSFPQAVPSSLNSNVNSGQINSLSDLLATSASAAVQYRVLVETKSDRATAEIKSLYPDAFNTVYRGQSMLQIGAFSDRSLAEKMSRSIADLGLTYHILDK